MIGQCEAMASSSGWLFVGNLAACVGNPRQEELCLQEIWTDG